MTGNLNRKRIVAAKRIVIKIGSILLVDGKSGRLHRDWLEALAKDIAEWRARGQEIILVSSGAVALGRRYLDLKQGELRLEEKQAAAAAGMVRLSHAYQETLEQHDLNVAQILLTLDDSENRRRYLNARSTISMLLEVGAIPLINENDTVATDEIRFGDNDRLAARVAAMMSADMLILLSDIDGLYTADPSEDKSAKLGARNHGNHAWGRSHGRPSHCVRLIWWHANKTNRREAMPQRRLPYGDLQRSGNSTFISA